MPIDSEKLQNMFNQFSDLMDENIKGVKIGCYSIALVGLSIAIHRVRPFTRFKNPLMIPNFFIKERRELYGIVERIEPTGTLLMVKHKPLIPLPFVNNDTLPVKICGIDITGHGVSWLQAIVVGQSIKFIPLAKEKRCVHCEILLDQQTHDNKLKTINIGECLVAVGFGMVSDIEKPLSTNAKFKKYYNQLKLAETNALRKKLGIRYYMKPTREVLLKATKKLNNLLLQKVNSKNFKLTVT